MAELLGRVERLAVTTGGQQQVAGQVQVKINGRFNFRIYICKFRVDQVYLLT
jgi:hypothetical protein